MNKHIFLSSFSLKQLAITSAHKKRLSKPSQLIQSAVLVPLVEKNDQLHVLLTKRAKHLRHHAGQISFPGGKVEHFDKNHTDTALREAQEEIGITRSDCNVIGQLPPYQTISGFSISPIIALLSSMPEMVINKGEVEEVFFVPFSHLFEESHHFSINVQHKSSHQNVHFIPFNNRNIWGATAAILIDLAKHVSNTKC